MRISDLNCSSSSAKQQKKTFRMNFSVCGTPIEVKSTPSTVNFSVAQNKKVKEIIRNFAEMDAGRSVQKELARKTPIMRFQYRCRNVDEILKLADKFPKVANEIAERAYLYLIGPIYMEISKIIGDEQVGDLEMKLGIRGLVDKSLVSACRQAIVVLRGSLGSSTTGAPSGAAMKIAAAAIPTLLRNLIVNVGEKFIKNEDHVNMLLGVSVFGDAADEDEVKSVLGIEDEQLDEGVDADDGVEEIDSEILNASFSERPESICGDILYAVGCSDACGCGESCRRADARKCAPESPCECMETCVSHGNCDVGCDCVEEVLEDRPGFKAWVIPGDDYNTGCIVLDKGSEKVYEVYRLPNDRHVDFGEWKNYRISKGM